MYTLYGFTPSGNCYKVRLLLEQLDIPYAWKEINILKGESRSEEFLEKSMLGKVPLLETDDGHILAQSNAILLHLGEGSRLIPSERWTRAKVYEWLFFEQNHHEPAVAAARYIVQHLAEEHPRQAEVPDLLDRGRDALRVMEAQLDRTRYLTGDDYSVADIALYAYTHIAPDAGFNLSDYPAIQAWIKRIEQQPGYVAMDNATAEDE